MLNMLTVALCTYIPLREVRHSSELDRFIDFDLFTFIRSDHYISGGSNPYFSVDLNFFVLSGKYVT